MLLAVLKKGNELTCSTGLMHGAFAMHHRYVYDGKGVACAAVHSICACVPEGIGVVTGALKHWVLIKRPGW